MNATLSPNDEPESSETPRVPEKRRSGPPPRTVRQLKMARASGDDPADTELIDEPRLPTSPSTRRSRPTIERILSPERSVEPETSPSQNPHLANLLQRWTGSRQGLHRALQAAALFFLTAVVASFGLGFLLGRDAGQERLNPEDRTPAANSVADPVHLEKLDVALRMLRDGESEAATAVLEELSSSPNRIASLDYAAALVAAHEQNRTRARQFAEASIEAGERVSDAYALLSATSTRGGFSGDHREFDLHKAIAADPMNERPFLELASLRRAAGDNREARRLLESAKVRLLPVNHATVIETTLELLRLDELPDSDLPPSFEPTGQAEKDFPAAFLEMRRGNFARAAEFLSALKTEESEDLFSYLIQDPAFTRYADQKEVAGFFRESP